MSGPKLITLSAMVFLFLRTGLAAGAGADPRWVEDPDLGSRMPVGQVVFQGRLMGTTARLHDEGVLAWDGVRTERVAVTPVYLTLGRLIAAQDRLWLIGQSPLLRLELADHTGTFYPGEILAQTNSGASAQFVIQQGRTVFLRPVAGTFVPGPIRGGRSEVGAEVLAIGSGDSASVLTRTEPAVRFRVSARIGFPLIGERVRQDNTGAEGEVIDYSVDQTHQLWVRPLSGHFEVDPARPRLRRLTGADSGARLESDAMFEQSSRFLPVRVFEGQAFARQLIDCGTNGPGGQPLLIWPESPVPEGRSGSIWASLDRGSSWTNLMSWEVGAVRHFHGGTFIPGTDRTPQRLVLYSGDADAESGLLVCTNVAELVTNPGIWLKRWALDQAGAARQAAFFTGVSRSHAFGIGQRYRVLDVVTSADGLTAYWLPDAFDSQNQLLMKCDLVTGRATPTAQSVANPGAQATRLANGTIVFNTMSEWSAPMKKYGGDEYLRAWALDAGEQLREIFRRRRVDWRAPVGLAYNAPPVEFAPPGAEPAVWVESSPLSEWLFMAEGPNLVGRLVPSDTSARVASPVVPPANLLENGQFLAEPSGEWRTNGCLATVDDAVLDLDGMGLRSLRVTPLGTGTALVSQTLAGSALAACRGRWVTLSVRVLADMTPADGQSAYAVVADRTQTIFNPGSRGRTNWQTWELQHWVPPDAESVRVELAARQSGGSVRPVWFSGARLFLGAVKGTYAPQLPTAAVRVDQQISFSLGESGVVRRAAVAPRPTEGDVPLGEPVPTLWEVDGGRLIGVWNQGAQAQLVRQLLDSEGRPIADSRTHCDIPGHAAGLRLHQHYAYVTTAERSLLIYDTGSVDRLSLVNTVALSARAPSAMAISGSRLLVVDFLRDVTSFDLGDPVNPMNPQTHPVDGGALDVTADGDLAAILSGRRRVEVLNLVTQERQPVTSVDRVATRLRFRGGKLAISGHPDRIDVWSVTDGTRPAIDGILTTPGALADFDFDDEGLRMLLADGSLAPAALPRFRIASAAGGKVRLRWQGDLGLERSVADGLPDWRSVSLEPYPMEVSSNGLRQVVLPASGPLGLFRLTHL